MPNPVAETSGRFTLIYLGVVESALPFLDNVVEKGWDFASSRLGEVSSEVDARFGQTMGRTDLSEARSASTEMAGVLERTLSALRGNLGPIASKPNGSMPTILNVTGSAAIATATAFDALPIWTLLGGRLVAEACVRRVTGPANLPAFDEVGWRDAKTGR